MQENNRFTQAAKTLSERLIIDGLEYELVKRISDDCVYIRFTGPFNDAQVVWNAKIQTLQAKFRHHKNDVEAGIDQTSFKQSIDISEKDNSYNIDIALNLKEIDEAAIKRTIIMIRKYKRLHPGHHEYGEAMTFNRIE